MSSARKSKLSTPANSKERPKEKRPSLYLIYGDNDFQVTEEARRILEELTPKGNSEFGVETIEGGAANQGEAGAVYKKLFEALQSQSMFATERVIWWRNTNLLGSNSTASAAEASESLATLNNLLKAGLPQGISLVITATDLDGRKSIAKTFQSLGKVILFKHDVYKREESVAEAKVFAQETAERLGGKLDAGALELLVEMSDADYRTILSELEKIMAYVGDAEVIREEDVMAIGSRRPGGVAWDLSDAVGARDLSRTLDILENLMFKGETPIGLIFLLISHMRLLLLLRALLDKKLLRSGGDYHSFKSQLDGLPSWVMDHLPEDKKLNPLASHPFRLFKAFSGTTRYTQEEIRRGLDILLECNARMVSGGGEPRSLLEEALVRICVKGAAAA